MDKAKIDKIGSALADLSSITSISHLDIVQKSAESMDVILTKKFTDDFSAIAADEILKTKEFQKATTIAEPVYIEHKNPQGAPCFICVIPFLIGDISVYCIVQAKSQIFDTDKSILTLTGKLISVSADLIFAKTESGDSRYKEELMKMRNTQARLFPKFDNIDGLDIAAVYLPTDLMTGTFLDAFALNKDTYQIVACDIAGNDPSSSFTGAAVRTLVRSYSSSSTIPSALIELIENRISKIISGVQSLLFMTVYQINQRSGKAVISSYGEINSIFFSKNKKGHIHINKTSTGQNLAKKVVFKDISMVLEPGDSLLFYTRGAKNAANENGQPYGEERIITNFQSSIELPARDVIHSLTETIYDFTNYANPADDIILMCIRKK